jgi:hypothetical protein
MFFISIPTHSGAHAPDLTQFPPPPNKTIPFIGKFIKVNAIHYHYHTKTVTKDTFAVRMVGPETQMVPRMVLFVT